MEKESNLVAETLAKLLEKQDEVRFLLIFSQKSGQKQLFSMKREKSYNK